VAEEVNDFDYIYIHKTYESVAVTSK